MAAGRAKRPTPEIAESMTALPSGAPGQPEDGGWGMGERMVPRGGFEPPTP